MLFTRRSVLRGGVFLLPHGATVYERRPVPLARCAACRSLTRILSSEFLPFKTFTLPVIESAVCSYTSPDPCGPGLRKVVRGLGAEAPVHTSLHRWCTALGQRALDRRGLASRARRPAPKTAASPRPSRVARRPRASTRPPAPPHRPPLPRVPRTPPSTAALVAESARRRLPGLLALWQESRSIPQWKYRSEKRREQLEACARLLAAANRLFPTSGTALTEWQLWLLPLFGVFAWSFILASPRTPTQHVPPPQVTIHSERRPLTRDGDASHGPRAPPRSDLPL